MVMTREVLHSKIENIERQNFLFNRKQIITITLCLITATASVVTAFYKYDNGIRGENKATLKELQTMRNEVKVARSIDSLNFVLLNQKMDDEFRLIDEKIKGSAASKRKTPADFAYSRN